MTPPEIVGARIRTLRRASGMTAAEVAERAGIARPNLHRIEAGKQSSHARGPSQGPRLATLVSLASALDTTVADLVRDLGAT